MGSALEGHAAGQGALAVRETVRELAACRTGSMGARSMTPPSPNTWPPASNIPGPTESAQVRVVTLYW